MRFCTNCGTKNADDWKFCIQCGHWLPEIMKSEKLKINVPKDGLLFEMKEMNWGQINGTFDVMVSQTWGIYRTGLVISYASYSISGDSAIKSSCLSKEKVQALCDMLNKFKDYASTVRAYDGISYDMMVYDAEGRDSYKITGYIYGNTYLEGIRDFVKSIPGFFFFPYGSASEKL